MSPYEMTPYRDAFDRAAASFGWSRSEVRVGHERDEGRSWTKAVWSGPDGTPLISEDQLSEGTVREIIRIADLLPVATG